MILSSSGSRPYFANPPFHVVVIRARGIERAVDCIDDIGGCRAQFPALLGGTGLYDYRMALRYAGHIQRPAHLKEPPMVIEHMHLCFIEITAARLVEQQSTVVPTVP